MYGQHILKRMIDRNNKRSKVFDGNIVDFYSPRQRQQSGSFLPSARIVSQALTIISQVDNSSSVQRESKINTLLMMQFGQYLDHDIAESPMHSSTNNPLSNLTEIK